MLTVFREMRAAIAVVSVGGSMLGCLAIHDLTPPNPDASTADPAAASDDATTNNSAATTGSSGSGGQTCVSGAPCAPAECQTGTFACTGGSGKCNKTGNVGDGTPCGSGNTSVCHAGSCGVCTAGADCTDMANPCVKKTIDCRSGQAVCKVATNAPDGTPCGAGQYCTAGTCSACTVGNSCSPASIPCHAGKVTSCAGGMITCTDQNAPAAAGVSCRTSSVPDGVCDGNGMCLACTPYATCSPPGKPCQQGTMTCTGSPVCGSTMNINDGKPCGGGQICSGGACAPCDAMSCANGCCDGHGCVTTTQTGNNCGTKGAACAPCASGQVCKMGGGGCSCPPSVSSSCAGTCTDVQTDPKNCGACGNDCTTKPHVMGPATCNAGVCSVPGASCAPGWAHCTANPADICETDLSQKTSCGTCGNVCPAATPVCAKGASGGYGCVTGCTPPAMTICGGTCTDSNTDVKNCGGCAGSGGTVCPAQTCSNGMLTAASTCSGGKCAAPMPTACGGFACNGAACFTSCMASNQGTNCPSTARFCIAGKCVPNQLANGSHCSGGSDCSSGFCASGVCCNEQCNGPCDSCSTGTCGSAAGKSCTPTERNAKGMCGGNRNCVFASCVAGASDCSAYPYHSPPCVKWHDMECGPNCLDCSLQWANATGGHCNTGSGNCVLSCTNGYADCNGSVADGCECPPPAMGGPACLGTSCAP